MEPTFTPNLRDFLSGCVYLIPMVIGFVGIMLLIGSMHFDFLGTVLLLGAAPLYFVFKWASDSMWSDEGDAI